MLAATVGLGPAPKQQVVGCKAAHMGLPKAELVGQGWN
jgi:hypothetical protein